MPIELESESESESVINEEYEKSKDVLNQIVQPLQWIGAWSPQSTKMNKVKISFLITHQFIHLSLLIHDLLLVFGDFESITLNLVETGIQSIFAMRIVILKFFKHSNLIIFSIKKDIMNSKHEDLIEQKILTKYRSRAIYYNTIFITLGGLTTISFYLMPLQNYFLAWISNKTAVLNYPYRMGGGNTVSSLKWNIIIYIYQTPVLLFSLWYISSSGLLMMAINHICGNLAILSYRMSKLTVQGVALDKSNRIIGDFVESHLKTVQLAKMVIDGFHIALAYELIVITFLISLLVYGIIVNIENVAAVELVTSVLFVMSTLAIVYSYSIMGQLLITESENLILACYGSNWYELPLRFRKGLIIYMTRCQKPLQLTAGKFYVYSFENFTKILKSSMAYVSMLRAVA